MTIDRHAFDVAAFNPFWRYAVCIAERPDITAIPYFSRAAALAFYDESRTEFPGRTTVLLRRCRGRRVRVERASR
jgi:hypothetical protein